MSDVPAFSWPGPVGLGPRPLDRSLKAEGRAERLASLARAFRPRTRLSQPSTERRLMAADYTLLRSLSYKAVPLKGTAL